MAYAAANEMAVSGDTAVVAPAVLGLDDIEGVMRLYRGRILRYAMFAVRDRDAAETITQECFLKAYRSLSGFRKDAAFSTWIHRIAVNICMDVLRKRARQKTESLDELLEREGDRYAGLLASAGGEERAERSDLVARFLSLLPPDQRVLLTLREGQGLTYGELAAVLGCSLDAVKTRLYRARSGLAKKLRHFSATVDV